MKRRALPCSLAQLPNSDHLYSVFLLPLFQVFPFHAENVAAGLLAIAGGIAVGSFPGIVAGILVGSPPVIAAGVVVGLGADSLPVIVAGLGAVAAAAVDTNEDAVAIVVGISFAVRPNIVAVPNAYSFPNPSSSAQAVGKELSGDSMDDLANDGSCSHLATAVEPLRKKTAYVYSKPNLCHSGANDTSDLPTAATTSRHGKRCQPLRQELRIHTSQGSRPSPAARKIQWPAAREYSREHLPRPSLKQEQTPAMPEVALHKETFSFFLLSKQSVAAIIYFRPLQINNVI